MLQINMFSVHRAVAHMQPNCNAYALHMQSSLAHMRPMCVPTAAHNYATQPSAYAPHVRYSWAAYALQEFKRAFILMVEGRTAKQELTFCLSQMSLSAPTQPTTS